MPKIEYAPHRFNGVARKIVDDANAIIADYVAQGYVLTLRQLFYRMVATDRLANTQKEYKHLGRTMVDARMAGETDWLALEDITRNVRAVRNWENPRAAVDWLVKQYHVDMWANQAYRVEVWIEKDALAGVFSPVCAELDVPFFSCRGYNSASEMWRAAQRMIAYREGGQEPIVLHFGDHDPSGIHMTRDLAGRFEEFGADVDVNRMALTIGQVKRYKLPPNPARKTDARYAAYKKQFGPESWELDALEPAVLAGKVRDAVNAFRSPTKWKKAERAEKRDKKKLQKLAMAML